MPVQAGFGRQAPVSRSPDTHRSFLNLLNFPKYRPLIQRFGLFGWENLAHFQASLHRLVRPGESRGPHVCELVLSLPDASAL